MENEIIKSHENQLAELRAEISVHVKNLQEMRNDNSTLGKQHEYLRGLVVELEANKKTLESNNTKLTSLILEGQKKLEEHQVKHEEMNIISVSKNKELSEKESKIVEKENDLIERETEVTNEEFLLEKNIAELKNHTDKVSKSKELLVNLLNVINENTNSIKELWK